MADGSANQLTYKQLSILSASKTEIHDYLATVLEHVRTPDIGPMYVHCWNGWHASGVASSFALRQFCGFSANQAVAYWNTNTDGHNDSSYESIRVKIRKFVPFTDLALTPDEQNDLCPTPGNLQF
jgi:hypothetical protein